VACSSAPVLHYAEKIVKISETALIALPECHEGSRAGKR
jgi:hypothetical protein